MTANTGQATGVSPNFGIAPNAGSRATLGSGSPLQTRKPAGIVGSASGLQHHSATGAAGNIAGADHTPTTRTSSVEHWPTHGGKHAGPINDKWHSAMGHDSGGHGQATHHGGTNRPGDLAGHNPKHAGGAGLHNGNRPGDVVWRGAANGARNPWHNQFNPGWFGNGWWNNRPQPGGWWNNGFAWNQFPWNYWWTGAAWGGLSNWFGGGGLGDPFLYDYGAGGNLAFDDDQVLLNGQNIGTAEEFTDSAAALADVAPPASEDEVRQTEWLPLGVFAVTTAENDSDRSRLLQLAVSKQGIISGTLYATATDQAEAVQGQVDPQTQRVAFRIGGDSEVVAETGMYNLTQDTTSLLVHFGNDRMERFLLVRVDPPASDSADSLE